MIAQTKPAQPEINVPDWVRDLTTFRRWCDSDDFPENHGRIFWLNGKVWVDMTKQQIFTHVLLKGEIGFALTQIIRTADSGFYLPDGALYVNEDASFGVVPDGMFISHASMERRRVTFTEGREGGFVEVFGSPDIVIEVVSDSSVRKDTVLNRRAYWQAGVREYWLVDARSNPVKFDIFKHGSRGYAATRAKAGWTPSAVLGKSFRFQIKADAKPTPQIRFEVK